MKLLDVRMPVTFHQSKKKSRGHPDSTVRRVTYISRLRSSITIVGDEVSNLFELVLLA